MTKNLQPSQAAAELLRRRTARKSFADFCRFVAPEEPPAKHHELICDAGDKIISGEIKRAMFLMPPGSAKSTYATVRFPAYYLGQLKDKGVICASYNDTLASRFGKKTRNLIKQPETQRLYPGLQLQQDSQAKGEWETEDGGFYFSVGIGGGVTGRRGDLGIIDDPIKGRKDADSQLIRDNAWSWYIDDFRTRLKPGASILLIQTRWHEDDLAGRILPEDWKGESGLITARDGEQWYVVCLPAQANENDILGRTPGEWLWLDWFDQEFWEQTKKTANQHDVRTWNSLYQQVPASEEGTFFKREWFKRFNLGTEPKVNKYQSTDFAVTDGNGDFTELGIVGLDSEQDIWALDWWYGQETADKWIDALLDQVKQHSPFATFGETGPIRRSVEPFMSMASRNRNIYPRLEWITRNSDKASMARAFQGMAAAGKVHIPNTDWGDRLLSQLMSFPTGKHDDAVDVLALFGMALSEAHPAFVKTSEPSKTRDRWDKEFSNDGDSWLTI